MKTYLVEVKGPGRWDSWTTVATFSNPISEMLLANYRAKYPGQSVRTRMEVVI